MRRRAKKPRSGSVSAAALAKDLEELRRRVAPLVPDIDPGDLLLILENLIRGPGAGRAVFIRQERPGVYVF